MLLEEAGEISDLPLQGGDLGLQGAKLLGQPEQRSRKLRHRGWQWGRWHLGERSQAALMQASQHLQLLSVHPFFAAIVRMAVQRELGIGQPAMQRFDIDAQACGRLGHRDKGHRIAPFGWNVQQERSTNLLTCRENSWEFRRPKAREACHTTVALV